MLAKLHEYYVRQLERTAKKQQEQEEQRRKSPDCVVNLRGSIIYFKKARPSRQAETEEKIRHIQERKVSIQEEHRQNAMMQLGRWEVFKQNREVRDFLVYKLKLRESNRRKWIVQVVLYSIIRSFVQNAGVLDGQNRRAMTIALCVLRCKLWLKNSFRRRWGYDFDFRQQNLIRRHFTVVANFHRQTLDRECKELLVAFTIYNLSVARLKQTWMNTHYLMTRIIQTRRGIVELRPVRREFLKRCFDNAKAQME